MGWEAVGELLPLGGFATREVVGPRGSAEADSVATDGGEQAETSAAAGADVRPAVVEPIGPERKLVPAPPAASSST